MSVGRWVRVKTRRSARSAGSSEDTTRRQGDEEKGRKRRREVSHGTGIIKHIPGREVSHLEARRIGTIRLDAGIRRAKAYEGAGKGGGGG